MQGSSKGSPLDLKVPKNPYHIDGNSAYIELKRKKGPALQTQVDTADLSKILNYPQKWFAKWNKTSRKFYVRCNANRATDMPAMYLHRYILGVFDPDIEIDHRNHDGLDNRKENLRIANRIINQSNRRGSDLDKRYERYQHVYWNKNTQKFWVGATLQKKLIYRGTFALREDAIRAANQLNKEIQEAVDSMVVVPSNAKPARLKREMRTCVVCKKSYVTLKARRSKTCGFGCRAKLTAQIRWGAPD